MLRRHAGRSASVPLTENSVPPASGEKNNCEFGVPKKIMKELFCDGVAGIALSHGMVFLDLFHLVSSPEGPSQGVPFAQIILPWSGFLELFDTGNAVKNRLMETGVVVKVSENDLPKAAAKPAPAKKAAAKPAPAKKQEAPAKKAAAKPAPAPAKKQEAPAKKPASAKPAPAKKQEAPAKPAAKPAPAKKQEAPAKPVAKPAPAKKQEAPVKKSAPAKPAAKAKKAK